MPTPSQLSQDVFRRYRTWLTPHGTFWLDFHPSNCVDCMLESIKKPIPCEASPDPRTGAGIRWIVLQHIPTHGAINAQGWLRMIVSGERSRLVFDESLSPQLNKGNQTQFDPQVIATGRGLKTSVCWRFYAVFSRVARTDPVSGSPRRDVSTNPGSNRLGCLFCNWLADSRESQSRASWKVS